MTRAFRAALLAAALAAATPTSAGLAESWYLARGRANMKIENYAAAVEAYESALRANPRSREASRGLGLARERNGDTDRAVAEFDRHLALFADDAEIAFEQARILQWSRYAYRSRDAVGYLRMGLAVRDDPVRRRELARLLGRERATIGEALAEYDRLLARAPDDRELRDERLKLLLWDPARRDDAIRELEARERERPDDERVQRELARLVAGDPARAGEAATRTQALLSRHPEDPDLSLAYARALVRAGRRAEARDAYARAIGLRPSLEARLERADLLAADPATREQARTEYEAVLKDAPRSRRARIGLARVFMARKETSTAALVQYQEVLRESPRDVEAHRGLARAYAWNGDTDRALSHGEIARRYAPSAPPDEVESALRRGREPTVGAGTRLLAQSGGAYGVSSAAGFVAASADPSPFTSSAVEGGIAEHRGDGQRAEGTLVSAAGELRPSPGERYRARFGWDGARLAGQRAGGELAYDREHDGRALSFAVQRAPRQDSFRALAGERVSGAPVGAAFDNVAEARMAITRGRDRLDVSGRAGAVTGAGFDPVFTAGASARADRRVLASGAWELRLGASARATHHDRDLSGSTGDPLAPRLFSPPLFLAASPRCELVREVGAESRLVLDAGPALQVTAGAGGAARLGGDFGASLTHRFGNWLRVGLAGRGERVAKVYQHLELAGTLAFVF